MKTHSYRSFFDLGIMGKKSWTFPRVVLKLKEEESKTIILTPCLIMVAVAIVILCPSGPLLLRFLESFSNW